MAHLLPQHLQARMSNIRRWLRWPLRVAAVFLLGLLGLVILVFNPGLMYANSTPVAGWELLHDTSLQSGWELRIKEAQALLQASEINNPEWTMQIALNDGSSFPWLMKTLHGDAFAYGYSNKIILLAQADPVANLAHFNGESMRLSQLLTHEAVHCLQYHDLGFWHSNPVAGVPNWKWEGYPEYIAKKSAGLPDLHQEIKTWQAYKECDNDGWIGLPDGTGVAAVLFDARLLVTYCMDIEGLSWKQVLQDGRKESEIRAAMMAWSKAISF